MNDHALNLALARLKIEQTFASYTHVAHILDKTTTTESVFVPYKIAMLRDYTVDPLIPVLKGEVAKLGLFPQIYLGEFDNIAQDVLNPSSAFYAFDPNIIFINQWSVQLTDNDVDRMISTFEKFVNAIRQKTNAPIVVNNFLLPLDSTESTLFMRYNEQLLARAREHVSVYIVDVMALGERLGHAHVFDQRYWNIGRAPISRNALIPLGIECGKFVRALTGKTAKCLVLDCDNVLWEGIVAEEGIRQINVDLQNAVLALHDQGIILALNSKNNEADVSEALERVDMVLHKKHFATWQINWDDKASNLMRIAQTLNIGLESIVFADDSAFECDFVRQRLPQVNVIRLSGDPHTFQDQMSYPGYFHALAITAEDKNRNQMYQDDNKRKDKMASASSLEEYLLGLNMVAEIDTADEDMVMRIAQLTQKTNQFNLTTRRYSDSDIRAFIHDAHMNVLYLKLVDNISDMGLVGVAILKHVGLQTCIDTFLLSCRVLGRGVEDAFLAHMMAVAQAQGSTRITGEYIATLKNMQVADFYGRHAFEVRNPHALTREWDLSLQTIRIFAPTWIKVINKRSQYAGS